MLNCIFSEPAELVDGSGLVIDIEYQKMDCVGSLDFSTSTLPAYLEKIENAEKSFFLEKNVSYGDFLIISFLILIFLGLAIGGIREFAKNRKLERL